MIVQASKLDSPSDNSIQSESIQMEDDQEPSWFKEIQREDEEKAEIGLPEKKEDGECCSYSVYVRRECSPF